MVRDLFSGDKALAAVAALGVVANKLDISLTNEGLFERRSSPSRRNSSARGRGSGCGNRGHERHRHPDDDGGPSGRAGACGGSRQIRREARRFAGDGFGTGRPSAPTDVLVATNPVDVLKKVDIQASAQ